VDTSQQKGRQQEICHCFKNLHQRVATPVEPSVYFMLLDSINIEDIKEQIRLLEYGDKVIWYVDEESSTKVYIAFQIILKTSYARHFERVTTGSSHQSTTSSTESGPHVVTRTKASFMIALDLVGLQVSKTLGFEKSNKHYNNLFNQQDPES
jgi:hypothetical protein